MEVGSEPEWVTAKRDEDGRFSAMLRGLWLRLLLFAAGLYVSDLATRSGVVAVVLLDAAIFFTVVFAWRARRLTLGTVGVAISVGVFQLAIWARGDHEPSANGVLLALSFILFVASLFVGNHRPNEAKRPLT